MHEPRTPPPPPHSLRSQFADDPEMSELVELFVSELPSRVDSLATALSSGEFAQLQRLAHQLKGASAGYGYPAIGQAAASVEETLRTGVEGDVAGLKDQVEGLIGLCRAAQRGLEG